jgi:hypothetical protein
MEYSTQKEIARGVGPAPLDSTHDAQGSGVVSVACFQVGRDDGRDLAVQGINQAAPG